LRPVSILTAKLCEKYLFESKAASQGRYPREESGSDALKLRHVGAQREELIEMRLTAARMTSITRWKGNWSRHAAIPA
jgi:hypothetical protein